jgi:hypothetical protein
VNRCLFLLNHLSKGFKLISRSQKNLTWQIMKKIGVKKKYYKMTATASAEVLSFTVAGGTTPYILVMEYIPTYHHYY